MSTIIGNAVTIGGGGSKLNIDYGANPPSDTTKLWVPLAKKPDAVECKPEISYGSEYISTLQNTGKSAYSYPCTSAVVGDELYLFGTISTAGGVASQVGYGVYNMRTNNLRWELWSSLTGAPSSSLYGFCCVSQGTDIYICGGVNNKHLYKLDTVNKSLTRLGSFPHAPSSDLYMAACSIYNGVIYVFGGGSYTYANRQGHIQYYDIANNSFGTKSSYIYPGIAASAQTIGQYIYVIGGSPSGSTVSKGIYRYSPDEDSTPVKVADLPAERAFFNSAVVGNNIYIFGGTSSLTNGSGWAPISVTSGIADTIYKFDVSSNSVSTVSATLAQNMLCPVGFYNGKIYLLNVSSLSSRTVNIIQSLAITSPLTSNHLFLQGDYGYDGLWTALKSKDTDFKVKVINAYLGDSNNIAQLTNAYLYDSKDLKWKSLSGESYVADMQNALNILGVN